MWTEEQEKCRKRMLRLSDKLKTMAEKAWMEAQEAEAQFKYLTELKERHMADESHSISDSDSEDYVPSDGSSPVSFRDTAAVSGQATDDEPADHNGSIALPSDQSDAESAPEQNDVELQTARKEVDADGELDRLLADDEPKKKKKKTGKDKKSKKVPKEGGGDASVTEAAPQGLAHGAGTASDEKGARKTRKGRKKKAKKPDRVQTQEDPRYAGPSVGNEAAAEQDEGRKKKRGKEQLSKDIDGGAREENRPRKETKSEKKRGKKRRRETVAESLANDVGQEGPVEDAAGDVSAPKERKKKKRKTGRSENPLRHVSSGQN